jgi:hypothetical protein
LGVLFSLVVGCGLVALAFYSSRGGYDDPPVLIAHEGEPEIGSHSEGLRQ